jgi:hypothetical protein
MLRKNFAGGQSRVIIDVCRQHGLWFDDEELAQVLAFVRASGGRAAREDLARYQGGQALRPKPSSHPPRPLHDDHQLPAYHGTLDGWPSIVSTLLEFVFLGLR